MTRNVPRRRFGEASHHSWKRATRPRAPTASSTAARVPLRRCTAGEAAIALCADPDPASVAGTAPFTTPGGVDVTSILLEPIPIKRDNLDIVLDAGWIEKAALCQGVDPAEVEVCA